MPLLPAQSINQASSEEAAATLALVSTSIRTSLALALNLSEVGRYDHFLFLYLALVCRTICLCLWGQCWVNNCVQLHVGTDNYVLLSS